MPEKAKEIPRLLGYTKFEQSNINSKKEYDILQKTFSLKIQMHLKRNAISEGKIYVERICLQTF